MVNVFDEDNTGWSRAFVDFISTYLLLFAFDHMLAVLSIPPVIPKEFPEFPEFDQEFQEFVQEFLKFHKFRN